MIKCIIFDMDGVLIDSRKAWFVIFNKALKKFENKEISEEEFNKDVWAVSIPKTVEKYFTRSVDQIKDFIHSQNDEFNNNINQFDDTEKTLKVLKEKGYKLTVATNSPKRFTESILKSLDIFDLFDLVVTHEDVRYSKPNPEMLNFTIERLNLTLKELNLKKEEVIMVGDTYWDKEAAKNANIKFIGFNYDNGIKNLKEILRFIKS